MPDKLFIGNFPQGLDQYRLPFFIDNNSFPTLFNFYSWRGRVKKKRGTLLLGRLQRQLNPSITLSGGGTFVLANGPEANANIAPGSFSYKNGGTFYTDNGAGMILTNGVVVAGQTINYITGLVTIPAAAGLTLTGSYAYNPFLPVMGLEDLNISGAQYPLLLAFDTTYSYQVASSGGVSSFYNVSYYKNPIAGAGNIPNWYTGYVQKSPATPLTWNTYSLITHAPPTDSDARQFWTTNYEGALWATNNNPGMQMQQISGAITVNSTTSVTLDIVNSPVVVGDFVFINEVAGANSNTINNQSGYVTVVVGTNPGTKTVTIVFPQSAIVGPLTGGVIQYLTNSVPNGGDGIRWYDGDPTDATGIAQSTEGGGWVNFAPPLAIGNQSIEGFNAIPGPFYLVGALAIVPYKDRLLFFAPYVMTSAQYFAGVAPTLLSDTVIWSWNGAPYYTASFVFSNLPTYFSILTPGAGVPNTNVQGAGAYAYFTNMTGFGGYLSAGVSQHITTVNNNEDVLLVGFINKQTRFVYTGNDLSPFLFYLINSEYGSSSTFSSVTLDRGALTLGVKGIFITTQTGSQRIDLQIPDQIFTLSNENFGEQRISGSRDFQREWVYFSYVPNNSQWDYPTQTFFYNYRDETWAIFYENYTSHGNYWLEPGGSGTYTWLTIPWTWENWNEPWTSGLTTALNQVVVGGNPEGYVLIKGEGTQEAPSGYISALTSTGGFVTITSFNHCVKINDYILLSGLTGPNASSLNGQIGIVTAVTQSQIMLDTPFPAGAADYAGAGQIIKLIQPLLQSKQFPTYWQEGYKVRVGVQKYLLDYTAEGQVTLNIYLSQDTDTVINNSTIVPDPNVTNSSLIYSQILYTCPESYNIGLTPYTQSINNPSPIANTQAQIWHRMNTSLIGDTFQIGITLSDAQMRNSAQAQAEITMHAAIIDISRGPMLT